MSSDKTEPCELCLDGLFNGKPATTHRRVPVAADWYGESVEWRLFAACESCANKGVADGDQPKKGGKS